MAVGPSTSGESGTGGLRGQTGPLGVLFVFTFALFGAGLILVLVSGQLGASQQALNDQQAEKALTQLDSKAALVALGNTDTKEIALPNSGAQEYEVNEGTGWMNVSFVNASGDTIPILNRTLGSITYKTGNQVVAYQGGGVWRTSGGQNSQMISPPEFHYRDRTLTLPVISVNGEGSLDNKAIITHDRTVREFPTQSRTGFVNPVNGTEINLTVRSQYYQGWGAYFEERTEGNVTYDHENKLAMISLVPPFDEEYDNAVATTESGGISTKGSGSRPTPNEEGTNYPSLDNRVRAEITDCETSPNPCDPLTSSITSPGTYYEDGDYSGGDVTISDPDGNVTIVVDGNYRGGIDIVDVEDPHQVTLYVRGDFGSTGNVGFNSGGDVSELSTIVHSSGSIVIGGNSQYYGLLYAPQSDCEVKGKAYIEGGFVCRTYTDRGNPASPFVYNSNVNTIRLDLTSDDVTQLQYLHITTNRINVTSP